MVKLGCILLLLFLTVSANASPYVFVDTIRQEYHQMKLLLSGFGYNAGAHNIGNVDADGPENAGANIWAMDVAQGVIVDSAFIDFVAFGNTSNTTVNVQFRVEDAVDADTLSTDGSSADKWADYNSRTFWGTEVAWNDLAAWTSLTYYRSPDIKVLIQHIVDQATWSSGNKILISVGDFASTSTSDAFRAYRAFVSYPTQAPILTVYYSPEGCDATETYTDTVFATADDAGYWRVAGGVCDWGNARTTLLIGNAYSAPNNCPLEGGIRLQAVAVDNGAVICSAVLSVNSTSTTSEVVKTIWWGEDVASATDMTSDDLSGRVHTTASVTWEPGPWTASTRYELDVTTLVQEIVNRGDWVTGNNLMLLYADNGTATGAAHVRFFTSYDGSTTLAPNLTITYTVDASEYHIDTSYLYEDTTGEPNCAGDTCWEWLSEFINDRATDLQAANKAIVVLADGPWVSQSWNGTDSVWDTLVIFDSAAWNQDSAHFIKFAAINEARSNGVLDTVGEGPFTIGNSDGSDAAGVLQIIGPYVEIEGIQILQRNLSTAVGDFLILMQGAHHSTLNANIIMDPNRGSSETAIGIKWQGNNDSITVKNCLFMGFNASGAAQDTCDANYFAGAGSVEGAAFMSNTFNDNDNDFTFAAAMPDSMQIGFYNNIHKSVDSSVFSFEGACSIKSGHISNLTGSADSTASAGSAAFFWSNKFGTATSMVYSNNSYAFVAPKDNNFLLLFGGFGVIDYGIDLSTPPGIAYGSVAKGVRGNIRPNVTDLGYDDIEAGFIIIGF